MFRTIVMISVLRARDPHAHGSGFPVRPRMVRDAVSATGRRVAAGADPIGRYSRSPHDAVSTSHPAAPTTVTPSTRSGSHAAVSGAVASISRSAILAFE